MLPINILQSLIQNNKHMITAYHQWIEDDIYWLKNCEYITKDESIIKSQRNVLANNRKGLAKLVRNQKVLKAELRKAYALEELHKWIMEEYE